MTPDPLITWAHPVAPQMHPRARASLVLGIVSILGVLCLLPVLVGPLAWYFGAVARRDIEREPTRWAGRSEASAGMICGIIGTALLALALLVGLIVLAGYTLLLHTDYGS
ncbi:MAG: hypothetical protein QOJ72_1602 [Nocardioidaceae bacterium]|jgi:hypothetical protein|nr:hypothetical protein [Nocardioidaceae bacterium]